MFFEQQYVSYLINTVSQNSTCRFAGGSGSLDNSASAQDGVLQNVNPSVILDINPQQSGMYVW